MYCRQTAELRRALGFRFRTVMTALLQERCSCPLTVGGAVPPSVRLSSTLQDVSTKYHTNSVTPPLWQHPTFPQCSRGQYKSSSSWKPLQEKRKGHRERDSELTAAQVSKSVFKEIFLTIVRLTRTTSISVDTVPSLCRLLGVSPLRENANSGSSNNGSYRVWGEGPQTAVPCHCHHHTTLA